MEGWTIGSPPEWLTVNLDGSVEIDLQETTVVEQERRATVSQLWQAGWRPLVREELSDPEQQQLGPFARDSQTSRKAALDNYPRQGSQRMRILNALDMENATREELGERMSIPDNSIRPRVKELIEGGWIEESDHTRPTQTGSDAAILKLTNRARDERAIQRHREGQAEANG